MFTIHREEIIWGGRKLVLETGHIARQADGAVVVQYGDTTVLVTVVAEKTAKDNIDFLPLTVNYQEKTYAAGKIPGGFFKREGRPSERETLISRLIDRPLRPLFPAKFHNEVQVIATVLSYDLENDPDIAAIIGASAALAISGIPVIAPIAAARVGYINGEYQLNPVVDDMIKSELDLVVAGTSEAVLMVESEVKDLPSDIVLGAVMFGHQAGQEIIAAIANFVARAGKASWAKELWDNNRADLQKLGQRLTELAADDIRLAYQERVKQIRSGQLSVIRNKVSGILQEEGFNSTAIAGGLKALESRIVRSTILDTHLRIDGRDLQTVRPIIAEVGVLPRTHGSALFTRGETQALVVATLGTGGDEQLIDSLGGTSYERFMLHYNFPPFSVGEVGRMGGTGRREIGHGKLAWRALHAVIPTKEAFPYTLRVVSEITESNGSSSMATVCGTSLALMDAGVPITKPIAGIAMGLIKDGDRFAVLSDILGDEDHLGDMDFKVAGSESGITALQMDIKTTGITEDIMRLALEQAREGCLHILRQMALALTSARDDLSKTAPRVETMVIAKDKIREVIGSGGKVIREIVEKTGAKIDIDDDGTIKISAVDSVAIAAAVNWIHNIASEAEVGKIYTGKVVKIAEFGAFVNFIGGKDGLVHISELLPQRVSKVTDVVNEGDTVKVKVLAIDDRGKIRLSMKVVDQETGAEIPAA